MAASPVTALTIITAALQDIGALAQGEVPDGTAGQDGLRRLNNMVDGWTNQTLTVPFVTRQVFALTANKGGPSNPYTMGTGGDFNVTRPIALTGAGLLMPGSPVDIEIPRAVITDDAYEANQVKDLSNSLFTTVYFNQTYPLATVILWPVPDTNVNSLVLYWNQQVAQFATLSTQYSFPQGYPEALEYNLAVKLATPYGRTLDPTIDREAIRTLAWIKRTNTKLSDLPTDPALTYDRRGGYNIVTGTGG